jgi:hypothetical protein
MLSLASTVERLASALVPPVASAPPHLIATRPASYAAAVVNNSSAAAASDPAPPGNQFLYTDPTTHFHHEEGSFNIEPPSRASSVLGDDQFPPVPLTPSLLENELVKPSEPLFKLPGPDRPVLSSHILALAIKSSNGIAFPLPSGHFVIVKEAPASKYSNDALSTKLIGDLNPSYIPRILYPTCFSELRAHADSMVLALMNISKEPWLLDMNMRYQAFMGKLITYWNNSFNIDTHKTQFSILIQCYIAILGNVICEKKPSNFLKLDELWLSYYSFAFRKPPTIPEFIDSLVIGGDKCASCKCFGHHKACCATTACLTAMVNTRPVPTNTELYKAFNSWKASADSAPHRSRSDLFSWYKSSTFADKALVVAHNAACKPSPMFSSYIECLKGTYLKQDKIKPRQIMIDSFY